MVHSRRALCAPIAVLVLAVSAILGPFGTAFEAQKVGEDKKPSLSLRASPPVGFSPLRVRVVVDVRGGPDNYAEFYCPSLQWDWGDGTISESSEDCEPYQEGKSTIRRRFSAEHVYRQSGTYRAMFRLKQRDKVIAASSANVQVRTGVREEFGR
jgi:hypothetical protein